MPELTPQERGAETFDKMFAKLRKRQEQRSPAASLAREIAASRNQPQYTDTGELMVPGFGGSVEELRRAIEMTSPGMDNQMQNERKNRLTRLLRGHEQRLGSGFYDGGGFAAQGGGGGGFAMSQPAPIGGAPFAQGGAKQPNRTSQDFAPMAPDDRFFAGVQQQAQNQQQQDAIGGYIGGIQDERRTQFNNQYNPQPQTPPNLQIFGQEGLQAIKDFSLQPLNPFR